jgi:hypothetical protein
MGRQRAEPQPAALFVFDLGQAPCASRIFNTEASRLPVTLDARALTSPCGKYMLACCCTSLSCSSPRTHHMNGRSSQRARLLGVLIRADATACRAGRAAHHGTYQRKGEVVWAVCTVRIPSALLSSAFKSDPDPTTALLQPILFISSLSSLSSLFSLATSTPNSTCVVGHISTSGLLRLP